LKLLKLLSYHPHLHGNDRFMLIRRRSAALDEEIESRRERYNALVEIGNARCRRLPDRLLAGPAGLGPRPPLPSSEVERRGAPVARAGGADQACGTSSRPAQDRPARRVGLGPSSRAALVSGSTSVELLP
jgi:hypothetical protein